MRIVNRRSFACVVALILAGVVVVAQDTQSPPAPSPTTRFIPVSGTLTDAADAALAGLQTVTFALFDEAEGGTLLWSETQTVTADDRGRYVAYLGAAVALPLEAFRSEQARWLQVSVAGRDLPRVMLVAVPYALKAADAETVGGKPASAFALASDQTARGTGRTSTISALSIEPLATSGTPGYLGMFTSATDLGNSMIYQSGTGIGLNTSGPETLFHVRSEQAPAALFDVYSNALGALPVVYRAARGTAAAPLPVQTDDILGGLAVRGYAPSGFTAGKGQIMFRAAQNWTDTANGTYLQFTTTPIGSTTFEERMRIDPSGNVGIGESPSSFARLGVTSVGANAVRGYNAASGVGVQGGAGTTGGTGVHGWAFSGNGVFGESNVEGRGVYGRADSGIGVYARSTTGIALHAYSISGSTIAAFTGPGKVGIGTDLPVEKLHVVGDIRVGTDQAGCVMDSDAVVIAGTCSSDRRFKQDVAPFGRSLERIARLQPVSFTWRAEEFPERHFGHTRAFGLIAQEVEAVLPDLVAIDAAGYKAVKYSQLPFYMLQAIKDLKTENDFLKSETDRLKQQLEAQEARLRRLEQLAGK